MESRTGQPPPQLPLGPLSGDLVPMPGFPPPIGHHIPAQASPHTPAPHTHCPPSLSPSGHSTSQTCSLYGLPPSVKGTSSSQALRPKAGPLHLVTTPPPAPFSQPLPKHRPDTSLPGLGPSNGSTPMGPENPEPSRSLIPSLPPPSRAGLQPHRQIQGALPRRPLTTQS